MLISFIRIWRTDRRVWQQRYENMPSTDAIKYDFYVLLKVKR